ncbi:2-dehydropantoate 2-reductase [Idiomarina sp. HP20-50]|uniref:ketopantoate reductase family protein n=1 Tax=Idiomarina sp. HP20-50 TaxID=3070813 RepID=UPI00294AF196|nr:2-dehydropantoate 2-reductase [Idiomarina sp. HP20-50]MDV6317141.1 2-dehydropantoate 2-reductase [Idiomarina sp. HP20-50]
MTKDNLNWVVLGPGAIGGLIAGGLLEQSQTVSLLPRHTAPRELNWRVIRSDATRDYRATAVQLPLPANSIFIVAVKAFDVIDALQRISELDGFRKSMPIVLSHNGMVVLPKSLQTLNLHHMVTTHGAVKSQDENGGICIEHRGVGRSWLEVAKTPQIPLYGSILQHAFPPMHFENDLTERRWLKLVINSVINPLTAINQCPNGELLEQKWQSQIYRLVEEAVSLAKQKKIPLTVEGCYQEVIRVAQETALNHSSMLQDVEQHRRTEIQQLTGYLISAGESEGIATPTHQALLNEFQKRYTF